MTSTSPAGQIVTFYSFKGGVGRTMALANIAWILASTGRRVLTVDWDLESPGLHRYFSPFLADRDLRHSPGVMDAIQQFADVVTRPGDRTLSVDEVRDLARVRRYATSLERYEFPGGGSIDFMPAGQQKPEYSRIVSMFNWDDFYTRLNGDEFLLALADDMRDNYDITLVDSRTGLSDNAGICTVILPDTVVNCFTYNNQSIDGAVAVARSIRTDPGRLRDVRIFPVPTRVEDGEAAKLDRRRSLAQQRFAEYVAALKYTDPSKYWGQVEVPYKVFYAYEETLATLGDPPKQQNTLLAAYERLASELVGEKITFAGVPEPVRRGWLTEFEQRGSANAGTVLVGYIPRERVWAEWIAHQLRLVGQRSILQDLSSTQAAIAALDEVERSVVILSAESTRSPALRVWWDEAVARDVPGQGRFLVPVRLDGTRLPEPYDRRDPVDVSNVSDHHARDALLSRLDLRDAVRVAESLGGGPSPRFPYNPARVWRVPARNATFVGRDPTLEELRERLASSTAFSGPAVLQGIGGVGKTQIAAEYLHRFAADYDIVWWISAEQPALVLTAMADLARELDLPVADRADRADQQLSAVLEALRLGRPSSRWIIVFDNNDDPEQLKPFIPVGGGDVIITTPGQEWSRVAWTLDVNVFDRSESIALLTNRVEGLPEVEAHEIAGKLGDLPLAVEQAASWLSTTAMSARNYLELLDEQLPRILDQPPPPGYRHPAAETWRLSQARLRQSNPAAALLAEICAFLAPEPIPVRLLGSPGMVSVLAQSNPQLRDPLLRGSLVREITRFGLARVDPAANALRMHRLVQAVLRSSLPEYDRVQRQGQVHVILAAEQRGNPDDPNNWSVYQSLLAHSEPAAALESTDTEVHNLVIDLVRYLRYRGDLSGAQRLGERAAKTWEGLMGQNAEAVLRMHGELGNVLNARGQYQEALGLLEDAYDRMLKAPTLGESHPYTLVALNAISAALTGLGQYQRARDLADQAHIRWAAIMGASHERTLMALNNLGLTLRFVGDYAAALNNDQELVSRSEKTFGRRHPFALQHRVHHGRDMREMGDLGRSEAALEQVLKESREALGEAHPNTCSAARNQSVTLRRLGRAKDGVDLVRQAQAHSEKNRGPRHPDTLACALEDACLRSALGDHAQARSRTEEIIKIYREVLGDLHPFTLAAINDLAVFMLRSRDYRPALDALTETVARMVDVLGADHPNTLTCQLNLSTARFGVGEIQEALSLDEACYERLRARFTDDHPTVLAAAANLATSRTATGDRDGGRALREAALRRATDKLGAAHPNVVAIRDETRITLDIDPADT
ncbi:FxSxx-COOH system tetratricopeptide repeat protein [Actinoplanes sp. NBC_00393]|uniref:FxSxx-COOH system tetratricopeptide repeat protein n=1 Tax=Actinoplanes sp. NBC_00393 TaxID=2975953 RepID=UPI002E2493B3